jgi:hypothetical protein
MGIVNLVAAVQVTRMNDASHSTENDEGIA